MQQEILRFADLAVYGIRTRQTLARRIAIAGFPRPFRLGARSRQIAWRRADVERWVEAQAVGASDNGDAR